MLLIEKKPVTLPAFLLLFTLFLSPAGFGQDKVPRQEKQPAVRAEKMVSLKLIHEITYPTRLAVDGQDNVYVSDFRVGSVFILDSSLTPKLELKGLDGPMGVAVDGDGNIFVGNKGKGNVEVYNKKGILLRTLGAKTSEFTMPTDIAVTADKKAFVADSQANCVKVYNPVGQKILTIGTEGTGQGELRFPSSVALSQDGTELYVGDQGNYRIQVFGLDGTFRREFGEHVVEGAFQGNFARIQSIAEKTTEGGTAEVHVVDTCENWIQVLTKNGAYIRTYGEAGRLPGQINLPLDIGVNSQGKIIVSNAGNKRVEFLQD